MLNLKELQNKNTFKYPIELRLPETLNNMNDTDILNNYNLNKINSNRYRHFVCYHYALRNTDIMELDDAYYHILENYNPVTLKNARKNDVITFHNIKSKRRLPDTSNIEHFAIISEINIEANILNIKASLEIAEFLKDK
jgi:hypothetical protein